MPAMKTLPFLQLQLKHREHGPLLRCCSRFHALRGNAVKARCAVSHGAYTGRSASDTAFPRSASLPLN